MNFTLPEVKDASSIVLMARASWLANHYNRIIKGLITFGSISYFGKVIARRKGGEGKR